MFSQYDEERFILEACAGIENGRLLDIGAWDAKTFSNSRALIELGWSAVLIEPSPGPLHGLVKEYGEWNRWHNVQVVGAALTVHGGLIELNITDDAVSQPTSDAQRIEEWQSTGGFFGKLTVPSISVADLFAQFGGNFEFVSIDTEGTSTAIFAEMLRVGPRPRCIVVEHDNNFVELSQHAEAAHYRLLHENGTNRVYEWTGRREG